MRGSGVALLLGAVALLGMAGEAHKPITSPYTFNDDVLPIVQARCVSCHSPGGVAPMSLATHADAVPWGESIRIELIAGHMPPWPVTSAPARFRNAGALTGRELNVLLTWASGGTPIGDTSKATTVDAARSWRLGAPDVTLDMPAAFTLAADRQEETAEFRLPVNNERPLWLRAVDLLPGTPAIVRSATIAVAGDLEAPLRAGATGLAPERVLALWLPGDPPVPLEGSAFRVPRNAELILRVRYRKTWEYEQQAIEDRSRVGLYVSTAPPVEAAALSLAPGATVLDRDLRALAVYADPAVVDTEIRVDAVRPDGSREEIITFTPRPEWARRYWFAAPIALPAGTRIAVRATPAAPRPLPPGATPREIRPTEPSQVRVVVNVVGP